MGVTLAASLLIQSTACRSEWTNVVVQLVVLGTLAGGLGSLVRDVWYGMRARGQH